jgi:hypothetical protein
VTKQAGIMKNARFPHLSEDQEITMYVKLAKKNTGMVSSWVVTTSKPKTERADVRHELVPRTDVELRIENSSLHVSPVELLIAIVAGVDLGADAHKALVLFVEEACAFEVVRENKVCNNGH